MHTKITFIFAIFILLIFNQAIAQTDLSFKVPNPPQSQLSDIKDLDFGDRKVSVTVYRSVENKDNIIRFYRDFFEGIAFKVIEDKNIESRDKKLLKFQKEELIVTISIVPKFGETQVVIAKYLQPKDAPTIKEQLRSFDSSPLFTMPKEDQPGEDLKFIPRPPQSIRWYGAKLGGDDNSGYLLTYAVSLTVEELSDFYREAMPKKGWRFTRETNTQDALSLYKNTTGKEQWFNEKQPPFTGINQAYFNDIISKSKTLDFSGELGTARIAIFPNFIEKDAGAFAQITYNSQGE